MHQQVSRQFLQRLDETTEQTGNVVDGEGRPLTAELLCRMLEKMEISFDSAGRIQIPTPMFPPAMEGRVRRVLEDPATQVRLNVVFVKKWFERYKL